MKLFWALIIATLLTQAFAETISAIADAEHTLPQDDADGLVKRYRPIKINCNYACAKRCIKSSRKKVCVRACKSCCATCNCVPPGTYGNKGLCPCYAKLRTHGNKPKCP